jgi:hypothetical protein
MASRAIPAVPEPFALIVMPTIELPSPRSSSDRPTAAVDRLTVVGADPGTFLSRLSDRPAATVREPCKVSLGVDGDRLGIPAAALSMPWSVDHICQG